MIVVQAATPETTGLDPARGKRPPKRKSMGLKLKNYIKKRPPNFRRAFFINGHSHCDTRPKVVLCLLQLMIILLLTMHLPTKVDALLINYFTMRTRPRIAQSSYSSLSQPERRMNKAFANASANVRPEH